LTRETIAGTATVALLCETFGLSRAAFYAEARRQRGEVARPATNVVALPHRPPGTCVLRVHP